ncbi:MAG TPA: NADH-quinone oxidoreductase subunit NuoH [Gemmatimonadales bacterium]|nr:NADH-quinone oxidoreductase subunit NuoH [Gemmatimonadales bacterium]
MIDLSWLTPEVKGFLLVSVLKLLLVFTVVMVGVAYATLMERKVSAWMQYRLGPNRAGFRGLGQPIADGIKNIVKEETYPAAANPVIFNLAPVIAFIPALTLSAVIPFAAPIPGFDFTLPLLGRFVHAGPVPMVVADLPVGFLFVLAISSLGVYGIALAGWSSNSKYSLLGGIRSSAQMISYEVAMGLSLIPVLLLSGNVSFGAIIAEQQRGLWYVLPLSLSFLVYLISGFAETNRLPFDLPEAESELVAGYHSEYSAMKFSLFFIAEYANMITISAMVTTLFFGGWDIPFTHWDETPGWAQMLATGATFFVKVLFWLYFFMWIRWTLPRFRYDQLMSLGWKFLLPLALGYVMVVAVALYLADGVLGLAASPLARLGVVTAVSAVCFGIVVFVMDRGSVIKGADRELQARRGRMRDAALAEG